MKRHEVTSTCRRNFLCGFTRGGSRDAIQRHVHREDTMLHGIADV